MTNALKKLLKVANDVITIYCSQEEIDLTSQSFTVTPYEEDKEYQVVNITFDRCSLQHTFLEPMSAMLAKTSVKWEIIREDKHFEIALYY